MRLTQALAFAGLALLPSTSKATASVTVETRSPAVAKGRLVEDIGVETLGGVFTPLLERRRAVPCEVTETFSTAADNQTEIEIRLFRGVAKLARNATPLGRFAVSDLPKAPRGTLNVAVTVTVGSDGSITLSAHEREGRAVQVRKRDG